MKLWQRGIELETLQRAAAVFREHDEGLVLGAFSGVNEARVATWMSDRRLLGSGRALAAARRLRRPERVKDFRRETVVELPEGSTLVERLGFPAGAEAEALTLLAQLGEAGSPVAAWLWQEHPGDRAIADKLGWRFLGLKIRASSELVGLWGDARLEPAVLPCRETLGLARLQLPLLDMWPLAAALDRADLQWEQHYSSYNERGSWTALALRGFSDSPAMIEKPAEMSRKWKAEHPELLEAPCRDTPLRAALPEAEPLLAAIPGPKERVRLMRLGAGGGLSRHADITDRDAGASEGRLLRIHVPLRSSGSVRFYSWNAAGERQHATMALGEAWFLDTRKPHAAANGGDSERIHLVMDCWGTSELLALLPC